MFRSVLGAQCLPAASYRASFLLCSLIISLSSYTITTSSAQPSNRSQIELQALLCFKQAISSDSLRSWSSSNFCRWEGVKCDRTRPDRVVSIDLTSNELSGVLPDCMANLTSLQTLVLARNNLEGTIPESLARSSSLVELNLSHNNLSGEIPASLFNGSSRLVTVDLQMNSFAGKIPLPHNMAALRFLGLSGNQISAGIPPALANISSLSSILLGQNKLQGPIPESLGQIQNLSTLDLSYNNLSGHVPATLYNQSSLEFFSVGSNILIGKIPSDIGHTLPNLESLIMSFNKFDGSIPASLANASNLQVLELSSNSLSGSVPPLGSLRNLNKLLLGINQFEAQDWSFLTSLTNCSQLLELSMDENSLNGSLPKSVGNLSPHLQKLNFGGNQISGRIPDEIGNFVDLTLLDMNSNMLSGEIPSTVGNLTNLVILNLSTNRFSGEIPSTVGNLLQLSKLNLDNNKLSGNIPANIGNCIRLSMLNFSVNNLEGLIPIELVEISSLSLGLDLSNNKLSGSIPQEVGALSNLVLLNFSNNQLSGQIPSSLENCVQLLSLNMEDNNLSGSIPVSICDLISIQQIDFSENNLSGPVPTGGIFQNSSAVNLEGNTGLCVTVSLFALPICHTSPAKRKSNTPLLLIVIPPITIALASVLCIVITLIKGSTNQQSSNYKETMKKVSYRDILKATSWFSPVNKISSSRTGSVYIGRFEFETDLVAIKVFHLEEHGAHSSFFTECEVLKRTRHRNLVKAITLCSTVDFENNEFKALVYEFMANGSLEMFVHPKLYQGSPKRVLTLGQRISIAADVASALDYLHNQLVPPMIHCDLKPSNVLLDYDMTSRIGDFGSAMFLSSSCTKPEGFASFGGTIGYIAPEYGMGCKISTGGDVYSFGVLLLEMLTGKRPTDTLFGNDLSLHKYVDFYFPDRIDEVLDPHMPQEDKVVNDLRMKSFIVPIVEIGLLCSKESPKDRPGMSEVCAKIASIKQDLVKTL